MLTNFKKILIIPLLLLITSGCSIDLGATRQSSFSPFSVFNGSDIKTKGDSWNLEIAGETILATTTITGNFKTNDNWISNDGDDEGLFITSSGVLGIGTNAPNGVGLHIENGDSTQIPNGNADNFVIEANLSNVGLNFLSNSNQRASIFFGDESNNSAGQLVYDHTDDHLGFFTAGSESMRLTAGRDLGVGADALTPLAKLHVSEGTFGGSIDFGANELLVEDNVGAGITVGTASTSIGKLLFADELETSAGGIKYLHDTDEMIIRYGNSDEIYLMGDTGYVGINQDTPEHVLHVNNNIAFGTTVTNFPSTDHTDTYIAGIGSDGILNITVQDGSGRSNFYWNAYYNSVAKEHRYISADEKAVNFEIGNGNFGIMNTNVTSSLADDTITWFEGYTLAADGTSYLKKDLTSEIVYLNRSDNVGKTDVYIETYSEVEADMSRILLRRSRGSSTNQTLTILGDNLSEIASYGNDSAGFKQATGIFSEADGDFSAGSAPGKISFRTTKVGATFPSLAMTIKSTQYVGIGDTTPEGVLDVEAINTTDDVLIVQGDSGQSGDLQQWRSNTSVLSVVDASGSMGVGTDSPDRKLHVKTSDIVTALFEGTENTGQLVDFRTSSDISSYTGFRFQHGSGPTTDAFIGFDLDNNNFVISDTQDSRATDPWLVINKPSQNVGIGTSTPLGRLHVSTGISTGAVSANANEFIIEDDSHAGLTILTPNTSTGRILFADPESEVQAGLKYDHSTDIATWKSEVFEFTDASDNYIFGYDDIGNVGIGTNTPEYKLSVEGIITSHNTTINNSNHGLIAYADDGQALSLVTGTDASAFLFDNNGRFGIQSRDRSFVLQAKAQGSDELFTVLSNGNVGINKILPVAKLHVVSSSTGGSVNAGGNELVIENDGASGLSILSNNTSNSSIYFSDSDSNNIGRMQYDHSNNSLATVVNGNEALRIDSSGNLGIGIDTPSYKLEIKGTGTNGFFGISSTTDGDILTIDSNGFLGIGTTTPTEKLSIDGNIALTGSIIPDNICGLGGSETAERGTVVANSKFAMGNGNTRSMIMACSGTVTALGGECATLSAGVNEVEVVLFKNDAIDSSCNVGSLSVPGVGSTTPCSVDFVANDLIACGSGTELGAAASCGCTFYYRFD